LEVDGNTVPLDEPDMNFPRRAGALRQLQCRLGADDDAHTMIVRGEYFVVWAETHYVKNKSWLYTNRPKHWASITRRNG
jgi:hypothetical protein